MDWQEWVVIDEHQFAHLSHDGATGLHTLPLARCCIPLSGQMGIACGDRTEQRSQPIVVWPNLEHRIWCDGWCLALFFSPLSFDWYADGIHDFQWCEGSAGAELLAMAKEWLTLEAQPEQLSEILGACFGHLNDAGLVSRREIDPRVRAVLQRLTDAQGSWPGLAELASGVGLSEHRLSHLFREQTGGTLRRYALFLRFWRAMILVAGGEDLSQSAFGAGFSDHAHLTRTIRKMTGRIPSDVKRSSKIVQAFSLETLYHALIGEEPLS